MTPIYAGDLPVLSDFFHLNFLSYLYRVETHERYRVTKLGRNGFSQPDNTAKERLRRGLLSVGTRKTKFETGLSFESRRLAFLARGGGNILPLLPKENSSVEN